MFPIYIESIKDIYIYICETPTNNKIWGISVDTIFTVLVTISIFLIGILVDRMNEKRKEKRRLKEIELYFYSATETRMKLLSIQIDSIQEFVMQLEEKVGRDYFLNEVPGLNFNYINDYSNNTYFKIFVSEKKAYIENTTKLYTTLFDSINAIISILNGIFDEFKTFIADFKRYTNLWNQNMEDIENKVSLFTHDNLVKNKTGEKDQFLTEVMSIFINAKKVPNFQNLYVAYEVIIGPLLEISQKYSDDKRAYELFMSLKKCLYAFNNVERLKQIYINYYKYHLELLSKHKKDVELVILEFKKL